MLPKNAKIHPKSLDNFILLFFCKLLGANPISEAMYPSLLDNYFRTFLMKEVVYKVFPLASSINECKSSLCVSFTIGYVMIK